MNVVQISKEDQEQSFEMLSAVLWLGNITFRVVEHDSHVVVDDNDGKHQPSFLQLRTSSIQLKTSPMQLELFLTNLLLRSSSSNWMLIAET